MNTLLREDKDFNLMNDFLIQIILMLLGSGTSIGFGVGMFLLRNIHTRLEALEDDFETTLTEQQVRAIINDKFLPLAGRLDRIESKLDRLIEKL